MERNRIEERGEEIAKIKKKERRKEMQVNKKKKMRKRPKSPWVKNLNSKGRKGAEMARQVKNQKLGLGSIAMHTQGPTLNFYGHPSRPKPKSGPIAQAQSELGPEIFKAHFEYTPATSKDGFD